jgi:hypothetical protein
MNAQKLARELMQETGDGAAIVEDAISICSYVSLSRGTELTIEEGSRVREEFDALHETAEVQS